MGISRDSWHKRRATGARQKPIRMKRRFELGRPPASTKIGEKRINTVRCRGGWMKFRALRLDHGNFCWSGEAVARKTRILTVVYNAVSNELVRTNTLVKGAIVEIDSSPFKTWYQKHYGVTVGHAKKDKKGVKKPGTKETKPEDRTEVTASSEKKT
jgi:small subunit ribosomal protein S8e